MNGTLSFDLLPQQAIWAHSARSRFPALVAQEKVAILTSRGVASFSTSIMDKSPRDSTALFIFFSHFSVPLQNSAPFSKFSCSSPSPHPIQSWNSEKKCRIHSSNIVCGVRGGVGPVWIGKRPRNAKCPKTFVQDNEDCSCRPGWLSVPHILKIARMTSTHWRHQTLWALKSFLAQANNTYFITSGRVIKPKICMSGPTGLWAGYTPDFYFASVHKNAEKNLANIQQFWSHTCQVWPDQ